MLPGRKTDSLDLAKNKAMNAKISYGCLFFFNYCPHDGEVFTTSLKINVKFSDKYMCASVLDLHGRAPPSCSFYSMIFFKAALFNS